MAIENTKKISAAEAYIFTAFSNPKILYPFFVRYLF